MIDTENEKLIAQLEEVKSQLFEKLEKMGEELSPFDEGMTVPVNGPLCCSQHGREVSFVFNSAARTYHHVINNKNGSKSICKSPVEIKRW